MKKYKSKTPCTECKRFIKGACGKDFSLSYSIECESFKVIKETNINY